MAGIEINRGNRNFVSISVGRFTDRSKNNSMKNASASPARMPPTATIATFFLKGFDHPLAGGVGDWYDADIRRLVFPQSFVNTSLLQITHEIFEIGGFNLPFLFQFGNG